MAPQYVYDAYDEVNEVIEPSVTNPATGEAVNPTYQYGYDVYGDQTSMTDAEGNVTTYGFNAQSNMVSETLPMGGPNGTEYWNYNGLGQLTSFIDFDGNETDYTYYGTGSTYGAPGQLATKTVKDPSGTTYETVTYEYNQNYSDGSYQDIADDSLSGVTTSTYDVNGNLVQITSPQGTINYTYDPATGEETGVSTSNTDTLYGYDQAGEMTSVTVTELDGGTLSTPLVTSYSYDLDGNLVLTNNANGTTEARAYNNVNELTSIIDSGPWSVYASFAYTYDLAGHVLTETDLGGATDKYNYDSLYRLTGESISDPDPAVGSSSFGYAYDLVGNRVSETDTTSSGTVTQISVFNANDELTSVTNTSTGGVQNYSYDANGNTTEVKDGDGTVLSTYTWDPRGRMIGATSGGNTVSYTYNDSDDRTSETVNDQTTTFLNDPNQAYDQVLEEYAEGGVLAATFIRGIDLLFEDQSGVLSYYASDNLGSTRALTNSAGAVTETYSYDAYGNLIAGTASAGNPYLFTGQWFDAAIGQYYLRARDLNPANGDFTSRDTYAGDISAPVTLNRYAYATGDPLAGVDPSGHDLGDVLTTISIGAYMTAQAVSVAVTPALAAATEVAFWAFAGSFVAGIIETAATGGIDPFTQGVQVASFEVLVILLTVQALLPSPAPSPGGMTPGRRQAPPGIQEFAREYGDDLETAVGNRMRAVDVPENLIGIEGVPGVDDGAFSLSSYRGGLNVRAGMLGAPASGIQVDTGALDPEFPEMSIVPSWSTSTMKDRVDAVIAHEYTEVTSHLPVAQAHDYAIENAPNTVLNITEGARAILRQYATAMGF